MADLKANTWRSSFVNVLRLGSVFFGVLVSEDVWLRSNINRMNIVLHKLTSLALRGWGLDSSRALV